MHDSSKAPIAVFVYNRPKHTELLLESLKKNEQISETDIYFFCDGPKENANEDEIRKIKEVHQIIRHFSKTAKTQQIVISEKNKGLANSIIEGINKVLINHDTVIILEDDLVLAEKTLVFFNYYLGLLQNNRNVMAISAYMFPLRNGKVKHPFFLRMDCPWGWATWKRAWELFEPDSEKLIKLIDKYGLKKEFNFGTKEYFYAMLIAQRDGKIDSWAIRWYASILLNKGLTLFPPKSYVNNIGMDNSGVHSNKTSIYENQILNDQITYEKELSVIENKMMRRSLERYMRDNFNNTLLSRLKNVLKKLYN